MGWMNWRVIVESAGTGAGAGSSVTHHLVQMRFIKIDNGKVRTGAKTMMMMISGGWSQLSRVPEN
jgi:hypothetical protein